MENISGIVVPTPQDLILKQQYHSGIPFDHLVIDNFYPDDVACALSNEFPDFNSEYLNTYNNPLEDKKTLNHWDKFPITTYTAFHQMGSDSMVSLMRFLTDEPKLEFDSGLHGGGWHLHSKGGRNNIHLDYSVHPKLKMQRKVNIIIYLSQDWDPEWGGGLELWSHDHENNSPLDKIKTVECVFNRAVIFATDGPSWHGLPNPIDCPEGIIRKSIAGYYVRPFSDTELVDKREKVLFAPRPDQINNPEVIDLIKKRSSTTEAVNVYKS